MTGTPGPLGAAPEGQPDSAEAGRDREAERPAQTHADGHHHGHHHGQGHTDSPHAADHRPTLPLVALIPNLVTLLGLCAGLTAIRYALDDRFEIAAALIVLAALIDGMDGLLARKLNAASSFGAELDSLSDFVCFGVAPGIVVWHFALSSLPGIGWLCVLVFSLCCCLRLARFNVSRDAPPPPGRAHFVGVPAPAGAMLGLFPVFLALSGLTRTADWPLLVAPWIAFVGLLMISRLPTLSPKGLRVARRNAPVVFVGVAVFAGLLVMRPWAVLAICCALYIAALAQGAWTHRRRLT
jgi:CDP-diacylglycerol---serine O-phosphatidyltransferase